MTLFEFLKAKTNHEIDITDDVFDMAVCFVLPDWDDPDLDEMDKSLIILAKQLTVNNFDNYEAEVNLTEWCDKNRKILDPILNDMLIPEYTPAHFKEPVPADEEMFYAIYTDQMRCAIYGGQGDSFYHQLYEGLKNMED